MEGIEIDKLILKTTNTSFNKYYWFLNDQLIKETSDPFIPIEKMAFMKWVFLTTINAFENTKDKG